MKKAKFAGVALGLLVVSGSAAFAHQWGCWRQPNRTVLVRNTAANRSQANAALNEWNADTILTIRQVSTHTEVSVFDGNYGNTGWGGLATLESTSGCSILHGHATLNTFYNYSSNGKRGVFCQEVGHLFGLNHSNDGGCMGGGYYYSIDSNFNVVSHNISDIASMYRNVSAATFGGSAEKHDDEASPLVQAVWYNFVPSVDDAFNLAVDVVRAEVVGVFDATDIKVKSGDFEHVVPNQRIAFQVTRTFKGDLSGTFDLFHTGNETFVLAGDPPYKVGEEYYLFVQPREDGSYLLVSPEGRYGIDGGAVRTFSEKEFSRFLDGTSADGFAQDLVERASSLDRPFLK